MGREALLEELLDWRNHERPVSVHLLHGRGGSGKTRLAVELCGPRHRQGWLAGFQSLRADTEKAQKLARYPADRLIVVPEAPRRLPLIVEKFLDTRSG